MLDAAQRGDKSSGGAAAIEAQNRFTSASLAAPCDRGTDVIRESHTGGCSRQRSKRISLAFALSVENLNSSQFCLCPNRKALFFLGTHA